MENLKKKRVVVPKDFHKEIKRRATEKETTIEDEIKEILKKEFGIKRVKNGE